MTCKLKLYVRFGYFGTIFVYHTLLGIATSKLNRWATVEKNIETTKVIKYESYAFCVSFFIFLSILYVCICMFVYLTWWSKVNVAFIPSFIMNLCFLLGIFVWDEKKLKSLKQLLVLRRFHSICIWGKNIYQLPCRYANSR